MESEMECCVCGSKNNAGVKYYGITWKEVGVYVVLAFTKNEEDRAKCKKFMCDLCIVGVSNAVITSESVL